MAGKNEDSIFINRPARESREEEEEMQIRVKCGCGDGSCPEWAIVELQGVVEAHASMVGGIQNLEIGRLCCTSPQGRFTFTVGYHELSATKMPPKKALISKVQIKEKKNG